MNNSVKYLVLISLIFISSCNSGSSSSDLTCQTSFAGFPIVDNIILIIGDGMGSEQRKAAQYIQAGVSGSLVMDQMPYQGEVLTASEDNDVTDSAAAATAMATGTKTRNGVIGMNGSLVVLASILEQVQPRGKATGLVTTTQLSHATPAAFASHVSHRALMTDIALQLSNASVDVLFGGGEDEFFPAGTAGCYPEDGERTDGRNLVQEMQASGYRYVCDQAGLSSVDTSSQQPIIGIFADEGLTKPHTPSLALMTQKSIEILANDPDGFFLMVEGGQIDWAGHDSDATKIIGDTIDLDAAVQVAVDYQLINGNTLIIVTADHETGGMSTDVTSSGAANEDGPFFMPDSTPFYVNWTTTGHTSSNVPASASGPGAETLAQILDNTCIYNVMAISAGL